MANRKRKDDECFQCYRRHLKEEEKEDRAKLQFRQIWTSNVLVPDADESFKDLPEYQRPLVKLRVRGTFDRSKGHKMPNSLYEKRKSERVFDKLKRKGVFDNAI
jgi:hypothetical protein